VDLAALSFEARLCFLLLPTIADREGRLEDLPLKISAQIFPYDSIDMEAILEQLASPREYSPGSFITRYQTEDGRKYLQINNFAKHQNPHPKEKQSDIAAPNDEAVKINYVSRKAAKGNAGSSLPSGSSGSSGSKAKKEKPGALTSQRTCTAPVRWDPKPKWKKDHPSLRVAQLIVERKHLIALQGDFPRVEGNGHGGGVEAEISKLKRHAITNPSWAAKKRDWPKVLGLTGQHENPDYAEEIAACVEKHGADIHTVANLITSGEKSLMRWCKHQCGFAERKT
jgi:hypothetical protein